MPEIDLVHQVFDGGIRAGGAIGEQPISVEFSLSTFLSTRTPKTWPSEKNWDHWLAA